MTVWMATVHSPNSEGAPIVFADAASAILFAENLEKFEPDAVVGIDEIPVYDNWQEALEAWQG